MPWKKNCYSVKHIPGHGCSTVDSHLKMPIVNLKEKNLDQIDFYPFKSSSSKLAMTAHILYKKIDPQNVSTFSSKIIKKIIRKKIGFKGILMSDDISMKALKYSFNENVRKAYLSGCNLVLHCNANMREMYNLAKIAPRVNHFVIKKTSEFYKLLS